MTIGQLSIIPLFPIYGLWMCIHSKSFDIVTEWYFWGCRFEDSDWCKEVKQMTSQHRTTDTIQHLIDRDEANENWQKNSIDRIQLDLETTKYEMSDPTTVAIGKPFGTLKRPIVANVVGHSRRTEMKNLTAYAVFVMQAYLAGCEIELNVKYSFTWQDVKDPLWSWTTVNYRIKLPDGWEYVIEDGEIAFREPKKGECYLDGINYKPRMSGFMMNAKRPIIKRKDRSE